MYSGHQAPMMKEAGTIGQTARRLGARWPREGCRAGGTEARLTSGALGLQVRAGRNACPEPTRSRWFSRGGTGKWHAAPPCQSG